MSKLRIVAEIEGERPALRAMKKDLEEGEITLDELVDIDDCELTIEGDNAA